jgi:hypothetical protein
MTGVLHRPPIAVAPAGRPEGTGGTGGIAVATEAV